MPEMGSSVISVGEFSLRGKGNPPTLRTQLFEGESITTLYEKVRTCQAQKKSDTKPLVEGSR